MSKGVACLALCTLLFALCLAAEAQQPKKIYRIGFLGNAAGYRIDAFRQGLRELGWVEGQNVTIEFRHPEGQADLRREHATELVRLKVDVIVTTATESSLAAQRATKTIPIVMAGGADPIGWGLVESLARPGGNITGMRTLSAEISGKRLELLKETFPKISRVAILWKPSASGQKSQMKETESAARLLRLELEPVGIEGSSDYENAFSVMKRERVSAFIPLSLPQFATNRARIVELANSNKLPAIYPDPEFSEVGGFMSYGPSRVDMFRRAAHYVDKILKGANLADLPVEQPTTFELVINLKTAKQIGVAIPRTMLMDADKVIK
jgi:putative ABC transport system substrate-binding protein